MRKKIILGISTLSCLCIFVANKADASTNVTGDITSETTWDEAGSPYLVYGTVNVSAPLTVKPGVIVKFQYYGIGPTGILSVKNELNAVGTPEKPIIFTSLRDDTGGDDNHDGEASKPGKGDWYGINIYNNTYNSKLEYVCVRHATTGVKYQDYSSSNYRGLILRNSEIKYNEEGIKIYNTLPVIENNKIENNNTGIAVYTSKTGRIPTIQNNSIAGNLINGLDARDVSSPRKVDARYNWWGNTSGPANPAVNGNRILGNQVMFDPWLSDVPQEMTKKPVIIIPGIMGSWEKDGEWQIDPIFHIYDNLYEEFQNEGYVSEKDLFTFPYQWRDSNKVNAVELRAKIQEIKNKTNRPKVDIVAHSMGGLLAREYIESSYYEDDVDQLITVGTPHLGAPKDYIKWEAGEFFEDIFEKFGRSLFYIEALKNGYNSTFQYIHNRPIASVQELLPIYNYLYDAENNNALRDSYPNNYPRNEFLENLNELGNLKSLDDIDFTKIVGKTDGETTTVASYNIVSSNIQGLWQDGYPKYFDIPVLNRQGINKSSGDGTVPVLSAEAVDIPADRTFYFPSEHGALPTDAQKDILEILTGKQPTSEVRKWHIPGILTIFVHCPIDIQVESPSGGKIGKNFETNGTYNEIEGAYYTGFNTNSEFVTIPNPEDGEYRIIIKGMEEGGKYKIEAIKISENPDDPDNAIESSALIEGETEPGQIDETKIVVNQNQVIYNPDTTPPIIIITSPEEKEYSNNTYTLDFFSQIDDEQSGVDETTIEKILNGQSFSEEKLDLSLMGLGNYEYIVSASDKAGNFGSATVVFQSTTNLNSIQNNVNHYWNIGLIKKKIARKYLIRKLKHLEKLLDLLEKTENSKLKPKLKQATINELKRIINADIDRLIRQINRKSSRWLDFKVTNLLIENLKAIKI